jgi:hypothetical protein
MLSQSWLALIRKILLNRDSFFTHRLLFALTNQYFCTIVTSHLEILINQFDHCTFDYCSVDQSSNTLHNSNDRTRCLYASNRILKIMRSSNFAFAILIRWNVCRIFNLMKYFVLLKCVNVSSINDKEYLFFFVNWFNFL